MIPDKSLEFYKKLKARRRGWDVIKPTDKQNCVAGSEKTLSKALALSELEIPVGNWITQELAKNPDIPQFLIDFLQENIEDEVKHDEVLKNLRDVFPVQEDDIEQAKSFAEEANRLAEIYSPLVLAGALETSVFFVVLPMYRFLGGVAFRTVSRDISNDESLHSAVNNQLYKDLGYRRGNSIEKLRKNIIDWLVADLPTTSDNRYLHADFWHISSRNLYTQGSSKNLSETKRAVMPSFFESSNNALAIYG